MFEPIPQSQQSLEDQRAKTLLAAAGFARRVKTGANDFYWIGGLSVLNSFISMLEGGLTFVIGLGLTQLVDAFARIFSNDVPDGALIFKVIGLVISVGIASIFAMFGYFAGKGERWAFIVGMILYALDALLLLVFTDWIGFFFHLYFLWGLWNGLKALDQLKKLSLPAADSAAIEFPKGMQQ